jgi:hypothetical protein
LRRVCVTGIALSTILATGPALADDAENVLRIREKSLEFLQALGSRAVDTYVKGRPSDFDRAYKTYHYLVNAEKIDELGGYVDTAPDETAAHAYALLKTWLELETMHAATAPEVDGGNNYMMDTEIIVGGEEIPLNDVVNRMAHEPDRSTRRQWSFAFKEFIENVNVYRRQEVHLSNVKAKELGYESFLAFLEQYKDFDIAAAQAEAQALVEQTDDLYQRLFEEQIQATYAGEMTRQEIRFYDMPRVRLMGHFDDALPEKKAFQSIEKAFKKAGIDLDDDRAGDVSARAADEAHARSGVRGYIDEPLRNMMTIGYKPASGFLTHAGMLREAGRLVYHGRAGGLYFEHHFFGDPTMAFAIGYLFENLMGDEAWLKESLGVNDAEAAAIRQAHAFHRLAQAREYAGHVLFLPQIYEGIKQPDEVYEQTMEPIRMWGHTEVDRVLYMEANDEFDCVGRLRGMILAVALENALVKRVGPEWWKDRKSAEVLAGLWSKGQRQRAIDFAASLDLQGFDPSLLVTDFDGLTAVVESP